MNLDQRCFQCKRPIQSDDDADVCVRCGGRNTLSMASFGRAEDRESDPLVTTRMISAAAVIANVVAVGILVAWLVFR